MKTPQTAAPAGSTPLGLKPHRRRATRAELAKLKLCGLCGADLLPTTEHETVQGLGALCPECAMDADDFGGILD